MPVKLTCATSLLISRAIFLTMAIDSRPILRPLVFRPFSLSSMMTSAILSAPEARPAQRSTKLFPKAADMCALAVSGFSETFRFGCLRFDGAMAPPHYDRYHMSLLLYTGRCNAGNSANHGFSTQFLRMARYVCRHSRPAYSLNRHLCATAYLTRSTVLSRPSFFRICRRWASTVR